MASSKILSILIPSITERLLELRKALIIYESYLDKYSLKDHVEIIAITDNKTRSIGEKRNDLISLAKGYYIVMTDDDDMLTEDYFANITHAIIENADVITYKQQAEINGVPSEVIFALKGINEEYVGWGTTHRPAWHCCTWRKDILTNAKFDLSNWGEDNAFAVAGNEIAESEYFIDKICHTYIHNEKKTAAFKDE